MAEQHFSRRFANYLFYPAFLICSVFLPLIFVVSYLCKLIVSWIVSLNPEYGNFLCPSSTVLANDFLHSSPKATMVSTLKLEGDISLSELRRMFNAHVLEATVNGPKKKGVPLRLVKRYPVLKQYMTSYFGFSVWKDEPNFQLEEHIVERTLDVGIPPVKIELNKIYDELLNMPYKETKSPWDIILIRNAVIVDNVDATLDHSNNTKSSPLPLPSTKTLIALRIHHAMADGKSILKLFVEGLGQKSLKAAQPQQHLNTGFQNATEKDPLFYLKFAINFVRISWSLLVTHPSLGKPHPWLMKPTLFFPEADDDPDYEGNVPLVTGFSPKVSMKDVKQVAKQNGVLTSSVILALVVGALRKYDLDNGPVPVALPQPKPNHPPFLCNNAYIGNIILPPGQQSPKTRLIECDCLLMEMKASEMVLYFDFLTNIFGNLIDPFRSFLAVNYYSPIGITNIAGEEEGFSVGSVHCSEFNMSAPPLRGCGGK